MIEPVGCAKVKPRKDRQWASKEWTSTKKTRRIRGRARSEGKGVKQRIQRSANERQKMFKEQGKEIRLHLRERVLIFWAAGKSGSEGGCKKEKAHPGEKGLQIAIS